MTTEEDQAEKVLNRLLSLLRWAWENQGQRYRLKKALVAWLADNDDGKESIQSLGDRFVEARNIDAIVARPKPPIGEVYIHWIKPGLANIAVFRGDEIVPALKITTERSSTLQWAVRLQRCLKEQKEQPIRAQLVDIDGVARVWADGINGDRELLTDQAYDKLTHYFSEKAPDGDIDKAIEEGHLPNQYEDFRLEIVELDNE